jgi:hypothetical protein
MTRRLGPVLLALGLAGCNSQAHVIAGDADSVVVDPGLHTQEGFRLAAAHCAKYGKRPRLIQRSGGEYPKYMFNCVKKTGP